MAKDGRYNIARHVQSTDTNTHNKIPVAYRNQINRYVQIKKSHENMAKNTHKPQRSKLIDPETHQKTDTQTQ